MGQPEPDRYVDRVMKYIPAEVVALFIFLDGSIQHAPEDVPKQPLSWLIFALLVLGTWFYLKRVQKVGRTSHSIISTLAFVLWVFYLGGPFTQMSWYNPLYGTLLLPLYTFAVGVIEPRS